MAHVGSRGEEWGEIQAAAAATAPPLEETRKTNQFVREQELSRTGRLGQLHLLVSSLLHFQSQNPVPLQPGTQIHLRGLQQQTTVHLTLSLGLSAAYSALLLSLLLLLSSCTGNLRLYLVFVSVFPETWPPSPTPLLLFVAPCEGNPRWIGCFFVACVAACAGFLGGLVWLRTGIDGAQERETQVRSRSENCQRMGEISDGCCGCCGVPHRGEAPRQKWVQVMN